jgi:hypothetical protein
MMLKTTATKKGVAGGATIITLSCPVFPFGNISISSDFLK